jgi:tellurite resistance protein TerC
MLPFANLDKDHFFVREKAKFCITPLFLSLLLVEISDIAFAIDSIPAIFAITADPFVVFTSNVFAILGLRAMYSLLAEFIVHFKYLRWGLAMVLVFVGAKMLARSAYEIPALGSLGVVSALIGGSIIASVISQAAARRLARKTTISGSTPEGVYRKISHFKSEPIGDFH